MIKKVWNWFLGQFRLSVISRRCFWFLFVMWAAGAVVLLPPDWFAERMGWLNFRNENRWIAGLASILAFIGWNYWWVSSLFAALRSKHEDEESTLSDEEARRPKVSVIGPIIGLGKDDSVRIVLGLPPEPQAPTLECVVEGAGGAVTPIPSKREGDFEVYIFEIRGLVPRQRYRYWFLLNGQELELQGGLTKDDCFFQAPGRFEGDDSFILMSCHNPYMPARGSAEDGWAMWPEVLNLIEKDKRVRFLVLGGDQVYNDDVEKFAIKRLQENPAANRALIVDRFRRQYQVFWQDPRYRKVMARIPSIAMWDDHDITDGWGGRPESFKRTTIRPEWREYYELARAAFESFQMTRNPPNLVSTTRAFTFYYDFGPNRIYMLDLRTERNSMASRAMEQAHETGLYTSLSNCPEEIRRIFVLSPVVPFRTNIGTDRRLSAWSRLIFGITHWVSQRPFYHGILKRVWLYFLLAGLACMVFTYWNLLYVPTAIVCLFLALLGGLVVAILENDELPNLSDDLDDALSSDANRATLTRLLRHLFDLQQKGRQAILLSGDIHVAGLSEVIESTEAGCASIPQIVSSPISYQPMPKAVEGMTTTTSEIVLADNGKDRLYARNIFYTSKRNFAQIHPARIQRPEIRPPVKFHYEGYQFPLAVHTDYLETHSDTSEGGA